MSVSVIEAIKADLITALSGISIANGYRNDVQGVGEVLVELGSVTAFPHLVVVFNDGSIDSEDDAKTIFSERQDIAVIGYVAAPGLSVKDGTNLLTTAAESLIHDLKKLLSGRVTTNIISDSLRSLISDKKNMFRIRRLYADNAVKGQIAVGFTIKVRYNQSSTF